MISVPLFKQSIKSNWPIWLVLTITLSVITVMMKIVLKTTMVTELDFSMTDILPYFFAILNAGLSVDSLLSMMGMDMNRIEVLANLDMNQMINNIFYSTAGVLMPMIFIIITANKLIASQVDRGSMAYVLSTPTKRSSVVMTQALFLTISVLGMFMVTSAVDILMTYLCGLNIPYKMTLLLNFGLFLTMWSISGLCFFGSSAFNYSKNSLALGGGLCLVFYVSKVLGLFGDPTYVAAGMGLDAMKYFNYFSIISLYDTVSLTNFINGAADYTFIWKFAILLGIGLCTYGGGMLIFNKKDLPL